MNYLIKSVFLLIFMAFLPSCSSTKEVSVSEVIHYQSIYLEKHIFVRGKINESPEGFSITSYPLDQGSVARSIALEIPVELVEKVRNLNQKSVTIEGVLKDHTFESNGENFAFKPLRLLVLEIS